VYSNEDLERLILLRRAILLGRSIGQIATLSLPELRRLVEEDEKASVVEPTTPEGVGSSRPGLGSVAVSNHLLDSALDAARTLDMEGLRRVLDEASVAMSRPAWMSRVLGPLMHQLGEEWSSGSLRIAHEHLATAVVRSFVGSLNGALPVGDNAPAIVVTTPAGELHEIGALLAAASAGADGWRTIYLGPSLPADEIAAAARQSRARAVALSLVFPPGDPHIRSELQRLAQLVAPGTAVLVGGRSAPYYRDTVEASGIQYLESMEELREVLEQLRIEPAPGAEAFA
jgi:methanogenic corrinoid protein MtbC1